MKSPTLSAVMSPCSVEPGDVVVAVLAAIPLTVIRHVVRVPEEIDRLGLRAREDAVLDVLELHARLHGVLPAPVQVSSHVGVEVQRGSDRRAPAGCSLENRNNRSTAADSPGSPGNGQPDEPGTAFGLQKFVEPLNTRRCASLNVPTPLPPYVR